MDETMLKMLQGVHDKARAAKIASAVSASRLRCCCVARLPDHGRLVLLHSITGGRKRAAALRAGRFAMKATPPPAFNAGGSSTSKTQLWHATFWTRAANSASWRGVCCWGVVLGLGFMVQGFMRVGFEVMGVDLWCVFELAAQR